MIGLEDIIIGNISNNVTHEAKLKKLAANAKTIEIICPFISMPGIQWLVEAYTVNKPNISIITELSPRAFMSGVQSIEALEKLLDIGCEIKFLPKGLHAKVYRFDKKDTLITSANMTESGLINNFEVGVCLSPGILNPGFVKNGTEGKRLYIDSVFSTLNHQVLPLNMELLDKYRIFVEEGKLIKSQIRKFEIENPVDESSEPYRKLDRNISNTQNLATDMLATSIFHGFKEEDWKVFQHDLDVSLENIAELRHRMDIQINPILRKFYSQLKGEPTFKQNLSNLQYGYSQHVQLKTRFPTNRYLYLTKNVDNKRANKHLGVPSYIIGMGSGALIGLGDDNIKGNWLEVRTGVEEDYFNEITNYGENFIKKIIENKEEVVRRFGKLGKGWSLSHGSYSERKQKRVSLSSITTEYIVNELGNYLITREPADIQIRRLYFTNDQNDQQIMFSPKVGKTVAEDLNHLTYFFDLAHKIS